MDPTGHAQCNLMSAVTIWRSAKKPVEQSSLTSFVELDGQIVLNIHLLDSIRQQNANSIVNKFTTWQANIWTCDLSQISWLKQLQLGYKMYKMYIKCLKPRKNTAF